MGFFDRLFRNAEAEAAAEREAQQRQEDAQRKEEARREEVMKAAERRTEAMLAEAEQRQTAALADAERRHAALLDDAANRLKAQVQETESAREAAREAARHATEIATSAEQMQQVAEQAIGERDALREQNQSLRNEITELRAMKREEMREVISNEIPNAMRDGDFEKVSHLTGRMKQFESLFKDLDKHDAAMQERDRLREENSRLLNENERLTAENTDLREQNTSLREQLSRFESMQVENSQRMDRFEAELASIRSESQQKVGALETENRDLKADNTAMQQNGAPAPVWLDASKSAHVTREGNVFAMSANGDYGYDATATANLKNGNPDAYKAAVLQAGGGFNQTGQIVRYDQEGNPLNGPIQNNSAWLAAYQDHAAKLEEIEAQRQQEIEALYADGKTFDDVKDRQEEINAKFDAEVMDQYDAWDQQQADIEQQADQQAEQQQEGSETLLPSSSEQPERQQTDEMEKSSGRGAGRGEDSTQEVEQQEQETKRTTKVEQPEAVNEELLAAIDQQAAEPEPEPEPVQKAPAEQERFEVIEPGVEDAEVSPRDEQREQQCAEACEAQSAEPEPEQTAVATVDEEEMRRR